MKPSSSVLGRMTKRTTTIFFISLLLLSIHNIIITETTTIFVEAVCSPTQLWTPIDTGAYVKGTAAFDKDGQFFYMGGNAGYIYKVNVTDGVKAWTSAHLAGQIHSTPIIDDINDRLYVGLHSSVGSAVALHKNNGTTIWQRVDIGDCYRASPTHVGDYLYLGTYTNGKVVKLVAATGATVWTFSTTGFVKSTVLVHIESERAFFGSTDNKIYCINTTNGTEIWTFDNSTGPVRGGPVLSKQGILFFGTDDSSLTVVAIKMDGSTLWSRGLNHGVVNNNPLVWNESVFVGTGSGGVWKLNKWTGATEASYVFASSMYYSSCQIAGDLLIIGTRSSWEILMLRIAPYSLTFVWKYKTGSEIYGSTPAVFDCFGFVIGSVDGKIYGFKLKDVGCDLKDCNMFLTTNSKTNSIRTKSITISESGTLTKSFSISEFVSKSTRTISLSRTQTISLPPTSTKTKTFTVSNSKNTFSSSKTITIVPPPTTTSTTSTTSNVTTNVTTTSTSSTTTTQPQTTTTTSAIAEGPTTIPPGVVSNLQTYEPIPSDLTEFPASTLAPGETTSASPPLSTIDYETTLEGVASVLEKASGATPPYFVTISVASRTLGSFIPRTWLVDTSQVELEVNSDRSEVSMTSSNATALAMAIRTAIVFNLSPVARLRGLQDKMLGKLRISDSSDQSGAGVISLKQYILNDGPYRSDSLLSTATTTTIIPPTTSSSSSSTDSSNSIIVSRTKNLVVINCTRGVGFSQKIEKLFVHPQQLPMSFTPTDTNGFPLSQVIRFLCQSNGDCEIRGKIEDSNELSVAVFASDQYRLNVTMVKIVPVSITLHVNTKVVVPPALLRLGAEFVYTIPDNLFVSSTPISYVTVRRENGFPLPQTVIFDPPRTLRGTVSQSGSLILEVVAEDYFDRLTTLINLTFTNKSPFCNATEFDPLTGGKVLNTSFFYIAPVPAHQAFEREIYLSKICSDPDEGDTLTYAIVVGSAPSWLRSEFRGSASARTLFLTGEPPTNLLNQNVSFRVSATDGFETTFFTLYLYIPSNENPYLIKNFTDEVVHPGFSYTWAFDIRHYFVDPNHDPLSVMVTTTTYAQTWVTTIVDPTDPNKFTISANPPEELPGESDNAKESDEIITVTVSDPFAASNQNSNNNNNNSSNTNNNNNNNGVAFGSFEVRVRFTLWMKWKKTVMVLVGLGSAFISIVTTLLLYHLVYNFFMTGHSTMQYCPLNAEHPRWTIPPETARLEVAYYMHDGILQCVRDMFKYINIFLWEYFVLSPFVHDGEPPDYLTRLDDALLLTPNILKNGNVDPDPSGPRKLVVRGFSRRDCILYRFILVYEEATKNWNLIDHNGRNYNNSDDDGDSNSDDDGSTIDLGELSAFLSPSSSAAAASSVRGGMMMFQNNNMGGGSGGGGNSRNRKPKNPLEDALGKLESKMRKSVSDIDTRMIALDLSVDNKDEEMSAVSGEVRDMMGNMNSMHEKLASLRSLMGDLLSNSGMSALMGAGAASVVASASSSSENNNHNNQTTEESKNEKEEEKEEENIVEMFPDEEEEEKEKIKMSSSSSAEKPTNNDNDNNEEVDLSELLLGEPQEQGADEDIDLSILNNNDNIDDNIIDDSYVPPSTVELDEELENLLDPGNAPS